MNHLEIAKQRLDTPHTKTNNNYGEVTITHALIAIAEQLEKLANQSYTATPFNTAPGDNCYSVKSRGDR